MPAPETQHYCEFIPSIFLKNKRIHQIFGPARIRMLLFLAQKISGPIFWVKSSNEKIFLYPDGINAWMSPDRLTFVYAGNHVDKLWALENIIDSKSSGLIIANLTERPNFNSVRRLNLIIKSNSSSKTNPTNPICIFFTDPQTNIPGVESRWHIKNAPSWNTSGKDQLNLNSEKWIFKRTYCRTNMPANWIVSLEKNAPGPSSIEKFKLQSFRLS